MLNMWNSRVESLHHVVVGDLKYVKYVKYLLVVKFEKNCFILLLKYEVVVAEIWSSKFETCCCGNMAFDDIWHCHCHYHCRIKLCHCGIIFVSLSLSLCHQIVSLWHYLCVMVFVSRTCPSSSFSASSLWAAHSPPPPARSNRQCRSS